MQAIGNGRDEIYFSLLRLCFQNIEHCEIMFMARHDYIENEVPTAGATECYLVDCRAVFKLSYLIIPHPLQ
jgi:hypothetical protein